MAKAIFPSDLLNATAGSLVGERGQYRICLTLSPFTYDGERVEETLDFRRVTLGKGGEEDLAGRTFEFPANPEPGYVESSVYLWSVHNPVDLRRVSFGAVGEGVISAEFSLRFVFDYEGPCAPLDKVLCVPLVLG